MAAVSPERARLLADAEAWNRYAACMNAKAVAAGLVTADEIARNRQATQAALARLNLRIVEGD